MRVRAVRQRRDQLYPVSPQRQLQAASAQLHAVGHTGRNGGHLLELATEGILGTVVLSRQNVVETKRAIAAFEEWAEGLDDKPDAIFGRPPERLVF